MIILDKFRWKAADLTQVTVLFADVAHSMDIAAAVGAERLREIMADLADRCATVLQRFGGTVDKFTPATGSWRCSVRRWRWRDREMARTLGFEGHIAWAEAMP